MKKTFKLVDEPKYIQLIHGIDLSKSDPKHIKVEPIAKFSLYLYVDKVDLGYISRLQLGLSGGKVFKSKVCDTEYLATKLAEDWLKDILEKEE